MTCLGNSSVKNGTQDLFPQRRLVVGSLPSTVAERSGFVISYLLESYQLGVIRPILSVVCLSGVLQECTFY